MVMDDFYPRLSLLCGGIYQSSVQSIYELTGVARQLSEGRRGRFRTVRSREGGEGNKILGVRSEKGMLNVLIAFVHRLIL